MKQDPRTPISPPPASATFVCETCGQVFPRQVIHQRFCGPTCRRKAKEHRALQRERERKANYNSLREEL